MSLKGPRRPSSTPPPTNTVAPAQATPPASEGISVCVRIRPPPADGLTNKKNRNLQGSEIIRTDGSTAWKWSDKRIIYQEAQDKEYYCGNQAQQYVFSRIYSMDITTEQLYSEFCCPVVRRTFDGYNCCIFAYGQTNSGKTYTISGTPNSPGIISLAVKDFFDHIRANPDRRSLLRVAFLEIYNEQLKDLLTDKQQVLTIKEDPDRGCPVVTNLTEKVVSSLDEVLELATAGEKRRAFGCNNVHEHASRSHTVFQLIFESRCQGEADIQISTLNIVDLAGSELAFTYLDPTGSMEANGANLSENRLREREGANIRKSLLALSRVVESLAKSPNDHIPYRDSKLTRILQSALGGNSNTTMIATINPWMSGLDDRQTNATLRFAMTAQQVDNHPKRVNLISSEQALLERYEEELRELRYRLTQEDGERETTADMIAKLQSENRHIQTDYSKKLKEREAEAALSRRRLENLSRFILTSQSLQGHDADRSVMGIGIDEEQVRGFKPHLPRPNQVDNSRVSTTSAAASSQAPERKRRHSLTCLRDSASRSLFGTVPALSLQDAADGKSTVCEVSTDGRQAFLTELNNRVARQQRKSIDQLRDTLKQRDEELAMLRKFCKQLATTTMSSVHGHISDWSTIVDEQKVADAQSTLPQKKQSLDRHLVLLESYLESASSACNNTSALMHEIDAQMVVCSTANKEIADCRNLLSESFQRVLERATQLKTSEEALLGDQEDLQLHQKELQGVIDTLNGRLTATTETLTTTQERLTNCSADLEQAQQTIRQLESTQRELENCQAKLETELRHLKQELETTKQALGDSRALAEERRREIESKAARIVQLEQTVKRKDEEFAALTAQKTALANEKSAFEQYYAYKKSTKHFQAVRALFIEARDPNYRPWLRFMLPPNHPQHPNNTPIPPLTPTTPTNAERAGSSGSGGQQK